jgi:predicted DNA-binding protein
MQQSLHDRLAYLVKTSGRNENEIMAEAIEKGVAIIYQKYIANDYLSGKLSREQAVNILGAHHVEQMEQTRQHVEQNIIW